MAAKRAEAAAAPRAAEGWRLPPRLLVVQPCGHARLRPNPHGFTRQPPALQVADGMRDALPPAAAAALVPLGSVQLHCSPEEAVRPYTLPHLSGLALDSAVPAPPALPVLLSNQAAVTAESTLGAPTPLASEVGNRLTALSLGGSEGGDSAAGGASPALATF